MTAIPLSSYRLQFNPHFGFSDAADILDYLSDLGITDIYASPIFKARKGSVHGYDVVNPNEMNPDLGPAADFGKFVSELKRLSMGWIQDIVPNHMAVDFENQMLTDVLENGPASEYFNYFDIEWDHPYGSVKGRLLAPFLGRFYAECLVSGEIQLRYDMDGFTVNYYDLKFPLKMESYGTVLGYRLAELKRMLGRDHPDFTKLLGIQYVLRVLDMAEEIGERHDKNRFIKRILWELYTTNDKIRNFLDENIAAFNGKTDHAGDFSLMDGLLSEQLFRLAFWKVTTEETNYRRFFNINGLISLRIENREVFLDTHRLISRLVRDQKITGLRIDHIDGLYDPKTYLDRLREQVGDIYIVVEKILDLNETIPPFWPVQGTTGYEFINYVNGVFCDRANEREFSRLYSSFIRSRLNYRNLVYENKKLIIDKDMSGDVDNLAHLLKRISANDRYGIDITLNGLRKAIVELLALFPVYRTYISREYAGDLGRDYVTGAIARAGEKRPDLKYELDFLERFLCLEFENHLTQEEKENSIHWVMKFQQMTGPLMAKGFEDTTLYVYNRMLSLNEVGGNPSIFGISLSEFHKFNKYRAENYPHAMSASSTHDTKRGEDVRARINVLSEFPQEWEGKIKIWNRLNRGKKKKFNGAGSPNRNDEYFIYQTAVGMFPFFDEEFEAFVGRIKAYIIKAIREAKVHTEWLKPDTAYEEACLSFLDKVFGDRSDQNLFYKSFLPFHKKIAHFGILNSLSQTLIKIAAPGVPDFYQGTELWDFSMVDPDNRRQVDFELRRKLLKEIKASSPLNAARKLLSDPRNGAIKLFLIYRSLKARHNDPELFQNGEYVPLSARGKFRNNVIAFARKFNEKWAVAVVPRFMGSLVKEGEYPLGPGVWEDTRITMPEDFPAEFTDCITGEDAKIEKVLPLSTALEHFPVALLLGNSRNKNRKANGRHFEKAEISVSSRERSSEKPNKT